MGVTGINGNKFILRSTAKVRFEAGFIDGADIINIENIYIIKFTGKGAICDGENLALCSSLDTSKAKIFETFDEAMAVVKLIGINTDITEVC